MDTPYDVFATNFRTRCIPDALVEGLGTAWSVTNGYHKMFACCNYAHAAVEATLDLRSKLAQRKLTDIEEIVVDIPNRENPMERRKSPSIGPYVARLMELLHIEESMH